MDGTVLNGRWSFGERLSEGGFGRVYAGHAEDGTPIVIKLVPIEPGANRELLFGEQPRGLANVIPILDAGEWEGSYFLVMPRADRSLREYLEDQQSPLPLEHALTVLEDVAEALAGLEPTVVHRDLKPENILLYSGHWCLADFGIARYAEAATASDTRKFAMTPPYAAPEQWRHERATSATDVYALGVVAFEMVEGRRPFLGPTEADYREQHLNEPPPPLQHGAPLVASLIEECLYKAPGARPKPKRILDRLRVARPQPSPAAARLQVVNEALTAEASKEEAALSAKRQAEEARKLLQQVASQSLTRTLDLLRDRISANAPAAQISSRGVLTATLGKGMLTVNDLQVVPAGALAERGAPAPFDVVAFSAIHAIQPADHYQYQGRAHSLWFCDAGEGEAFRWYELAFMIMPGLRERSDLDPFAIPPTDQTAAEAFSTVMGVRQLAWGPAPLDQGDEEQFIERWMGWFAEVATGRLAHPRSMPEGPLGAWRRAGWG